MYVLHIAIFQKSQIYSNNVDPVFHSLYVLPHPKMFLWTATHIEQL
jgi:hypothetical protein